MAITKISFGTDGYRGVISDTFTFSIVRNIAQGFSDYMANKYMRVSDKPEIIVGYDRRFMSGEFAELFAGILEANGFAAFLSKTAVTTPVVSRATYKKNALGVMITASHNKYMYNGVKIKEAGKSASPAVTAEIENYITKASPLAPSTRIRRGDFVKNYVSYVKSRFNTSKIFSSLKGSVVVDFMCGSGADVAPQIFNSKKIIPLRTQRDPLFGLIPPEPIENNLSELSRAVKEKGALFGVALDGDGDRFAMVDEKGRYLSPHQIAPMFFEYLAERKKIRGKMIQAVSMGYLTKRIAEKHGMLFEEVPVGFKYIAEKMVSEEVAFGVEESGGYSWKGNMPERDGIMTALLAMEMAGTLKSGISDIYSGIEKKYGKSVFIRKDLHLPETISNKHSFAVKCKKKIPKTLISKKVRQSKTIDGLKVSLEDDSWFLIRPSGTEPLLRIYAEAAGRKEAEALIENAEKAALSVK